MSNKMPAAQAVANAKSRKGCDYWYCSSGEAGTKEWLDEVRRRAPSMWNKAIDNKGTTRYTRARDTQCDGKPKFDCVGLMRAATGNEKDRDALYTNAEGLRQKSNPQPIATMPEIPGIMLFIKATKNRVGHVGIYCGNGIVAESHGFKRVDVWSIKNQKWEQWGFSPWIDYTGIQHPLLNPGTAQIKPPTDKPAAKPAEGLQISERVRIKQPGVPYFPGEKSIPGWVVGRVFTVSGLAIKGGVPCARLKEITSWCDTKNLEKV